MENLNVHDGLLDQKLMLFKPYKKITCGSERNYTTTILAKYSVLKRMIGMYQLNLKTLILTKNPGKNNSPIYIGW